MLPEDMQRGEVSWDTYRTYFKLGGGWKYLVTLMIIFTSWMMLSTLSGIQM
jgi:hypothetical protein